MDNSLKELEQIVHVVEHREAEFLAVLPDLELGLVGGGTGDISLG